MWQLGRMYDNGEGVKKNLLAATDWYRKSENSSPSVESIQFYKSNEGGLTDSIAGNGIAIYGGQIVDIHDNQIRRISGSAIFVYGGSGFSAKTLNQTQRGLSPYTMVGNIASTRPSIIFTPGTEKDILRVCVATELGNPAVPHIGSYRFAWNNTTSSQVVESLEMGSLGYQSLFSLKAFFRNNNLPDEVQNATIVQKGASTDTDPWFGGSSCLNGFVATMDTMNNEWTPTIEVSGAWSVRVTLNSGAYFQEVMDFSDDLPEIQSTVQRTLDRALGKNQAHVQVIEQSPDFVPVDQAVREFSFIVSTTNTNFSHVSINLVDRASKIIIFDNAIFRSGGILSGLRSTSTPGIYVIYNSENVLAGNNIVDCSAAGMDPSGYYTGIAKGGSLNLINSPSEYYNVNLNPINNRNQTMIYPFFGDFPNSEPNANCPKAEEWDRLWGGYKPIDFIAEKF